MNLKQLKDIILLNVPDETKEQMIIRELSKDESVIPLIMEILAYERKRKAELLEVINLELSRAHIGLENPKINKDHFMDKEIIKFYLKNKDHVGHCFKDLRNVELPPEDEDKLSWT